MKCQTVYFLILNYSAPPSIMYHDCWIFSKWCHSQTECLLISYILCEKWIIQWIEQHFVLTGICVFYVEGKIKMTSLFHQLIVLEEIVDQAIKHYTLNVRSWGKQLVLFSQCLHIFLMSGVTVTSASQTLEYFFGLKNHNEKSHFQTFQHMVLACICCGSILSLV